MNAKMFKKALVCLTLAIPFATSSSYCMNEGNSDNIDNSNNIYNKYDKSVPVIGNDELLNFVNNNNNSNNKLVDKSMLLSTSLNNHNQSSKNNMDYDKQSSFSTPHNNNPNNNLNHNYKISQNKAREKIMHAYGAGVGKPGFILRPSKEAKPFLIQQAEHLNYLNEKKKPVLQVAQQNYNFPDQDVQFGASNNTEFGQTSRNNITNINDISNYNNINDITNGKQPISDENLVAILNEMNEFTKSKDNITIDQDDNDNLLLIVDSGDGEGSFKLKDDDLRQKYPSDQNNINKLFEIVSDILSEIKKARDVVVLLCKEQQSFVSLLDSIPGPEDMNNDAYLIQQLANNYGVEDNPNIKKNDNEVYNIKKNDNEVYKKYTKIIRMIRTQHTTRHDFLSKLSFQAIDELNTVLSRIHNGTRSIKDIKSSDFEYFNNIYGSLKTANNAYQCLLFLAGVQNANA